MVDQTIPAPSAVPEQAPPPNTIPFQYPGQEGIYDVDHTQIEEAIKMGGVPANGYNVSVSYPNTQDLYNVPSEELIAAVKHHGAKIASPDDVTAYDMAKQAGIPEHIAAFGRQAATTLTGGALEDEQGHLQRRLEQKAFPASTTVGTVAGVAAIPVGLAAAGVAAPAGLLGAVAMGAGESMLAGAQMRGAEAPVGQKLSQAFDVGAMTEDAAWGGAFAGVIGVAGKGLATAKEAVGKALQPESRTMIYASNLSETLFGKRPPGPGVTAKVVPPAFETDLATAGTSSGERLLQQLRSLDTPEARASLEILDATKAKYNSQLSSWFQEAEKFKSGAEGALPKANIEEMLVNLNKAARESYYTLWKEAKKYGGGWEDWHTFFRKFSTEAVGGAVGSMKEDVGKVLGGEFGPLGSLYILKEIFGAKLGAGVQYGAKAIKAGAIKGWEELDPYVQDLFKYQVGVQMSRVEGILTSKAAQIVKNTVPTTGSFVSNSTPPNAEQVSTMTKVYTAATNPPKALSEIEVGNTHMEYIDTLKEIYPAQWNRWVAEYMGKVGDKVREGHSMSEQDKLNFFKITGMPFDNNYSPYMQNSINQFYNVPQQQGGIQSAQVPKQSSSRVSVNQAGKSDLANRMLSDDQRVTYTSRSR